MSEASSTPRQGDRPAKRASMWRKTFLLAGLLWGLTMILPDTYRLFWPVGTLGFSADNDGLIYSVDEAPAATASIGANKERGLRAGDAVDLSVRPCLRPHSDECRNFMALFAGMGGLVYVAPGTTVKLPILVGGVGPAINVELTAADHILEPITKFFLLLVLIAGFVVIWRAFRLAWDMPNGMTLGFFLYAIWFNPGPYYVFYALLQPYPVAMLVQEGLQAIAQGAGYAGFLLFALHFPRGTTEPRFRWVEYAVVPIGVLLAVMQLASFLNVFGVATETMTRCAIFGGYVVDLAVLVIAYGRRKLQPPLDYQRMRWVLWGCLIGLPAFIFADSNEATSLWARHVWSLPLFDGWTPPEWLLEALFLVSGLLAMCVCEAARKPLVINVGYRLQGLFGILAGIVGFAVIDNLFGDKVNELFGEIGLSEHLLFATRIGLALLCGYLGDLGGHAVSHLLNRRFHHMTKHLREAAVRVERADDPDMVESILVRAPFESMRLTSSAVFREVGDTFRRLHPSIGWHDTDKTAITVAESPTLQRLISTRAPVRFSYMPREREGFPSGAAFPAIAIPIATHDRFYAVAVYGPHDIGDDIDPMEADVLEELAESAARGYERSEMAALRHQIHTLQQRVAGTEGLGDPHSL